MKKATQQQTKTHNSRLVLKTIYDQGQISRADIARLTHLTRTTISDLVARLMAEGLVAEVCHGLSAGGKPPILLGVVEDSCHLIGIDLAGSEFKGAITDLRGRIIHRQSLPVNERKGEAALELVYELINKLIAVATKPLVGIGLGAPGLINPEKGIVRTSVILDWQNFPLRDLLKARYNLPVYIANDSQAAAVGEYTFGRCRKTSSLIVVKAGRGVGAGIVLNGQLYYGDGFGAGEIGHVTIVEGGERCLCGHCGCLETVISSRAIVKQAKTIFQNDPHSALRQFAATPEAINIEIALQAFEAGDKALLQVVKEVGHYLGMAVANLAGAFNIQCILIGGHVASFGETLLEPVRQEMRQRSLTTLAEETYIEVTCLGDDIVILGAAALLLTHELGLV